MTAQPMWGAARAAALLMVGLAAPPDAGATRRGMLTISPASYDFGDAVLRTPQENQMFEVSVQQGNAELVKVSITGPDAGDFKADATTGFLLPPPGAASGPTCRNSWPQPTQGTPLPGAPPPPPARPKNECEVWVAFIPRTIGPKNAVLTITEPGGATLTAAHKGNGVSGCTSLIVSCNYAFMYSGVVSWRDEVKGPSGRSAADVTVAVKNGVGDCSGPATRVDISEWDHETNPNKPPNVYKDSVKMTTGISGRALVAVEFDFYEELEVPKSKLPPNVPSKQNESNRSMWMPLGYKVTVACPSPGWPAGPNGEPATPSTPAEFDGRERSSYPQNATALLQKQLQGRNSASPEDDALNGVTSTMIVNWRLARP